MDQSKVKSKDQSTLRKTLIDELSRLGEVASTEAALFHQKVAEKYGLGLTEMKALSCLFSEGSMSAGKLAQRLALTTGAVTNVIDRLEARKAVQRLTDPNDRRKVIVAANAAEFSNAPNYYQSIGDTFRHLHESYTTEQLEFLVEYHHAEIELTRKELEKLDERGRSS